MVKVSLEFMVFRFKELLDKEQSSLYFIQLYLNVRTQNCEIKWLKLDRNS